MHRQDLGGARWLVEVEVCAEVTHERICLAHAGPWIGTPVGRRIAALTRPGGCSDTTLFGSIHETAGSLPAFAAEKKLVSDWMFPSWPLSWTVWKCGSGFQIPAVVGPCATGAQVIALSFSQSGSLP